jgi:hypothetical protein
MLTILKRAANGFFPAEDGGYTIVPRPRNDLSAVICFTGHVFLAAALEPAEIQALDLDGFGRPLSPTVLQRIAKPAGRIGDIDLVLTAFGRHETDTPAQTDGLADHPRVMRALQLRQGVRVFGNPDGFVTLGVGIFGRLEISIEIAEKQRGHGIGRHLLQSSLGLVPLVSRCSPRFRQAIRGHYGLFSPPGSSRLVRRC